MNKDCIKVDDMHLISVNPNNIHGYVKAEFGSANGHVTTLKVKLPATDLVYKTLENIKRAEVEVYIVRKGSNMANLGMAIIKSSFDEGFSGADDYERHAVEVRKMIGTRILTKVEPVPEFIHHTETEFIHHTETDIVAMRIEGVTVATCKMLHAYVRPDGVILFEALNFGRNGMVEAVDYYNTDYFKRRTFEKRAYNSRYVRPATEAQHLEYLKLKYEYLKSLEDAKG